MLRFVMPVILIGISISTFFLFTTSIYNEVGAKRAEVASYDEALKNSKMLENERDKLTAKHSSIDPENLAKLQKLLPENVDNIRLILEIEQIALPYGMSLRDVKYSATTDEDENNSPPLNNIGANPQVGISAGDSNKNYGVWDLSFSTTGSYSNFLNFIQDLESNLRIVDISSIQFSSDNSSGTGSGAESYKYDFRIKTYWLKN